MELVKCEICGLKFKQIGTGHLRSHGLKAIEYKARFPGSPLTSPGTRSLIQSKARLRPPQTEEKKKRISSAMKKVYANPNFKLHQKNQNQVGNKNHFYGKSHSRRTKDLLSKSTSDWMVKAYAEGRKVSPFTWLGFSNSMSKAESHVFEQLAPLGFVFDYKVPFPKGCYKIDFALPKYMLGFELDSALHRTEKIKARDARKDKFLAEKGWTIFRIQIGSKTNLNGVVRLIKAKTKKHKEVVDGK